MANIRTFSDHQPQVAQDCFIDPSAIIIGKVILASKVSLWPTVVLRGDVQSITIGKNTNIQDGTIIHVASPTEHDQGAPTIVGENVTVGHRALIHGCTIGDNCLIGMGCIILDGAEIGEGSLIGAGALITPSTKIPARSVALGSPAKVVRQVTDEEYASFQESANHYWELALQHEKALNA